MPRGGIETISPVRVPLDAIRGFLGRRCVGKGVGFYLNGKLLATTRHMKNKLVGLVFCPGCSPSARLGL